MRFILNIPFECRKQSTCENVICSVVTLIFASQTDACVYVKSHELEVISVFTLRTRIHAHNRSPLAKSRCLFYGHFYWNFLSVAFRSWFSFLVNECTLVHCNCLYKSVERNRSQRDVDKQSEEKLFVDIKCKPTGEKFVQNKTNVVQRDKSNANWWKMAKMLVFHSIMRS